MLLFVVTIVTSVSSVSADLQYVVSLAGKANNDGEVFIKEMKLDSACSEENALKHFCTRRGLLAARKTAAVICRSVMDEVFATGDVVAMKKNVNKSNGAKERGFDFICNGMENNIAQCIVRKVRCDLKVVVKCSYGGGQCTSSCGCMAPALIAKVIGGEDAYLGEFPWQVTVIAGDSLCGGSIIDELHVLSAAHCFHSNSRDDVPCKAQKGGSSLPECKWQTKATVYYDSVDFITKKGARRKSAQVEHVFIHKEYVRATDSLIHDLVVIRLKNPLELNDYVQPVCLPDHWEKFSFEPEALLTVTGFGDITRFTAVSPDKLQKVNINWENLEKCKAKMPYVGDDHFCAGDLEGKKDACRGDSGGPLVYKNNQGVATLVGVVSFSYGCARPGLWSVYANVERQIGFIRSVMNFSPHPNDVVLSCKSLADGGNKCTRV